MNPWNKNVGIIIAEIMMLKSDFQGFFWLVEGPSDIRFFQHRKFDDVELVVAGGKRNVIDAIAALQTDTVNSRVLGIVDADIDWLVPIQSRPSNIISTDPRDLEGLLLRSKSLEKVLSEYGDPKKINDFEARRGKTVREHIRELSEQFGKIRAANVLNRDVALKCLKPQNFILSTTWDYNFDEVIDFCLSRGVADTAEDLNNMISALPSTHDWNYVRGHDAVSILVGGLMKEIGSLSKVDNSRVESALRVGIEDEEYRQSKIYSDLSAWRATAHNNRPQDAT